MNNLSFQAEAEVVIPGYLHLMNRCLLIVPVTFSQSHVSPWLYWPVITLDRLCLALYFGAITIRGEEHLRKQGPVVLAPKHFSRWDPLVLASHSPEPLRFMTNANQFAGLQGWLIKRLGAFPVEIARPQLSSLRHTIALLHAGNKV
ncbi:MAG TPA: lysophospholipid acyltransferase family protein, partial [Candidatus Caenarcaniphilales bacterium]